MDWQKTLNLVAIGVVIWLLLIEWDKWDSENKQQIAASEVYVPELQASDLPVPQADDLGSELPVVVQDLPIEVTPVINSLSTKADEPEKEPEKPEVTPDEAVAAP